MTARRDFIRNTARIAAAMDAAHRHPDKAERAMQQAFVDLMIPVVKGWSTETGIEIASTGVEIHGGMGYMREAGIETVFRDARVTRIYEGTSEIQRNIIARELLKGGA